MTATDELRKMLDERGVEWQSGTRYYVTHWSDCERNFTAVEQDSKLYVQYSVGPLTPAQAIAATLGDTDATRARQGDAWACHDKNGFDFDTGFECTACGAMTDGYVITTEDTGHQVPFNFCPNCGRRVVDE